MACGVKMGRLLLITPGNTTGKSGRFGQQCYGDGLERPE
jgi:hypothetical protein